MDHSRTIGLIGAQGLAKLNNATVLICGIGGVGSYAAESLCRAGVGSFILIDNDVVKPSNINRQLIALNSTLNMYKTIAMKERMQDINPEICVKTYEVFFDESTLKEISLENVTYVIDAIDSVKAKLFLIKTCYEKNIPIISAMGAGNKLYPEMFEVTDIYRTKYDPLARVIRKQLKQWEIPSLKVVCSCEESLKTNLTDENKHVPASISFVPSVCGLLLGGAVVRDIIL